MSRTRPAELLWLIAGFGLWGTALVTIYALHALGCAFAWSETTLRWTIGFVLLSHVLALLLCLRWQPGTTREEALRRTAQWLLVAALAATLFSFGPLLFLTTCV